MGDRIARCYLARAVTNLKSFCQYLVFVTLSGMRGGVDAAEDELEDDESERLISIVIPDSA